MKGPSFGAALLIVVPQPSAQYIHGQLRTRGGQAMVGIFVGNTDNSWFNFLAAQPGLDEVNFWRPSAKNFYAIAEGEQFAFRLKSPRDCIGGFGVLAKSAILPIQLAWEAFGIKNGVPSLGALIAAIAPYRPDERVTTSTFIGCRVLVQPVFLPERSWLALPDSWARNIVGGKRFSTDTTEGLALWRSLQTGVSTIGNGFADLGQARYGEPAMIVPRLGQGAFRVTVTELYGRQCALTEGKVLPALDAAHIKPYADGGTHSKSNGILLRKDIHSVFDAGYATIDSDHRFVVSDKVRDVFNNGHEYRRLHGRKLNLPQNVADHPDRVALRWHNDERFLG